MSEIKQILVVDDDHEMNLLIGDFLKRQGYAVSTASSVAGALDYLKSLPPKTYPHLVISDVQMGAASGLDLLKKLSIECPQLPVILFSVFEGHEKEALKHGARRFLRKPFPLAKLNQIVIELIA